MPPSGTGYREQCAWLRIKDDLPGRRRSQPRVCEIPMRARIGTLEHSAGCSHIQRALILRIGQNRHQVGHREVRIGSSGPGHPRVGAHQQEEIRAGPNTRAVGEAIHQRVNTRRVAGADRECRDAVHKSRTRRGRDTKTQRRPARPLVGGFQDSLGYWTIGGGDSPPRPGIKCRGILRINDQAGDHRARQDGVPTRATIRALEQCGARAIGVHRLFILWIDREQGNPRADLSPGHSAIRALPYFARVAAARKQSARAPKH